MADIETGVKVVITGDASSAVAATDQAAAGVGKLRENTRDLTGVTEKATEAGKEQEKHLEGSRLIFSELNRVVPEFGHLLHAAFEGPVGIAITLAIAVVELKNKLKEYNAELDKVTDAELAEHQKTVAGLQKSWDDAAISLGDYFSKMATAGDDKDPIKTSLERIKALTDAELESSRKIIEAQGKVEIARLRGAQADPTQIDAAKARQQAELDALDRKKDFGEGVGGLQTEQAWRSDQAVPLQAAALKARQDKAMAEALFESNQEELKDIQKQLNDPKSKVHQAVDAAVTDEALDFKQKQADALRHQAKYSSPSDAQLFNFGAAAIEAEIKKAKEDRAVANAELAGLQKREGQLEGQVEKLEDNRKTTETKSLVADQMAEGNNARLKELPGELGQAKKIQSATDAGRIGQQAGAAITQDQTAQTLAEAQAALKSGQEVNRQLAQAVRDSAKDTTGLHSLLLQEFAALSQANRDLYRKIEEAARSH